jgi:hypothetical protein
MNESEKKGTPAIVKQEGKKTVYKCGKNANNKDSKKEIKPEVKENGR